MGSNPALEAGQLGRVCGDKRQRGIAHVRALNVVLSLFYWCKCLKLLFRLVNSPLSVVGNQCLVIVCGLVQKNLRCMFMSALKCQPTLTAIFHPN